ncbi:MAG: hypothetical protein A2Y56_10280 [Candidatus Aminicenantes bacterium RBG_13_63_10]|nr:MAG: hypothetical protein A2Y56_10280 [Candidatus Aminicenantes bacterium RBG_13_63_10]
MVRDYPLTGVGLGSFIIELPNYGQRLRLPLFKDYTDSAENHYLHVAAETGLLGLALYLWLFIAIVKRMSSRWMGFSGRDPSRFVFLGAASGLAGFFVNFLFHSYMASYEVYFGFWILAAMIYAFPQPSGFPRSEERKRSPRPVIVAAALAVLAFGAVHLWNSAHSLSISSRTREFGWPQDFGLYAEEKDEAGFSFRWTRRTAGLAVAGLGQEVVLPVLASHPDLERKPVTLKVFAATRDFRKLSLIREVVLRTRSWGEVSWRRTRGEGSESYILLETDRAWLPKRAIGADDSRSLAVAVGVAWFRYPRDVPPESVESVRILPRTGWEGGQGNRLTRSGRAKISFRSGPRCLVRLRLRGSAAFGIGPLIAVSLDGAPVARTFIRTDGWSSLVLPVRVGEGDHVIEVDFLNDIAKDAEDRNVALGDMEVISLRGQAPELRRKWRHDD